MAFQIEEDGEFPEDYNPLVCPNCGCDDFYREESYFSYLSTSKNGNMLSFDIIDQEYNETMRPTVCCSCTEEIDEYKSEKYGRVMLCNDLKNIYPTKKKNAMEQLELNKDEIVSVI